MKSKTKLLFSLAIVLALIAGFLIGTTVHLPSAGTSGLAGTIGKVNNYRNVKISENDIKLRSELLDNEKLCQQLQRYFTFHYASNVQLTYNIGKALKASEAAKGFSDKFNRELKSLSGFNSYLGEARKDYLLLLAALGRIKDTDQQSIGLLINNANNAVVQTKYRNQAVVDFTDAVNEFFKTETPVNYPDLLAVHDALLLNLINNSVVTGDKMMIRFLDKKEFLGSRESIQSFSFGDKAYLNNMIVSDMAGLGDMMTVSDKQNLNSFLNLSDKQNLNSSQALSSKENLSKEAMSSKENLSKEAMSSKENLSKEALSSKENLSKEALSSKENLSKEALSSKENLSKEAMSSKENLSKEAMSSKENLSKEALSSKENLSKEALSSKENLSKEALSSKENLSKEALSSRENLSKEALSSKENLNSQALFSKENLQSNSFFNAEALNMIFLNSASQFLSSQKSGLESNVYFDAHSLESSASFNDKGNLNSTFLQDMGVLNAMLFQDAGILGSFSNKE